MPPTKNNRRKACLWGMVLILLMVGGVLYLAHGRLLVPRPDFFLTPIVRRASMYSLLLAGALIVMAILIWSVKHRLNRGFRHALLHARLLSKVEKALLEAGYYIPEGMGSNKVARLPRLKLTLDNDLTTGVLQLGNHVHFEKPFESICLSSCLGHFVVDQHYLSDSQNEVIFEISDSREQRQLVFDSAEAFLAHSKQRCGAYELFIDGKSKIPLFHFLVVGMTGSGKSYALFSLILQMLGKLVPYHLYFADPKMSDLGALGKRIAKENTAESIEDIIVLLRKVSDELEKRKPVLQERLPEKHGGTYEDFGFAPHIFIIDEFSSFMGFVAKMDKSARDDVAAMLKNIVLQGRQFGFFLWIVMQKSDASSIPTEIRENLPGKFVLGQSERMTYETCFGPATASKVPNRRYLPGHGVFTFAGIANMPKLCYFPTLNFDVPEAIAKLSARVPVM